MAADDPLYLGPWERDRVLGTGGFGIVTLWKNNNNQEKVAIKKCRWGMDSIMTQNHKERWAREVVIMQRLSHLNVVRAVQVPAELQNLPSDLPLLCMEFCSGGDLRQILNKPENCCGLRETEVRCLLSDIKAAVEYLHSQRITHRDLKPENIVLQEKPDGPMVYKLIDLGYAKELETSSMCCSFVGTMQYLAPEFFTSSGYSSSVDYWSLGLVSHEAITGVRPFLPNASSPVDWMPKVEKKSTNDICIYEVPALKNEIKYSQQLFVENFISQCLREQLEKWLRLALEWNPKKRGRTQPDNKLGIFSLLDEILSQKIVTVFCVSMLANHSYQVDSATAVSTLQLWIERDTRQPVNEQLLLLPSGKQLTQNNMAIDCWNPNEITMLYVFDQTTFSLPYVKVADRVPALVRWLMENPKEALEYHHQKHVWRHAVFFLRQEYELYQLFLEAYAVKMLSLLEQSYELSQQESAVGTEIEHLVAMQKMSSDTLEFDSKCYGRHLGSIPSLAGLGKLMTGWATEMNSMAQRVASYREALTAMRARVQEAHRRTGSLQEYRDPGQNDLVALESWMNEGYKCYDNIRKRKDRTSRYQSLDMARILYNCFKQIDITYRNEGFGTHLKLLMSCEAEIKTLNKALTLLKQQVLKSKQELMRCQYLRQKETWALVKRLANQKEQDSRPPSSMSLNTLIPNAMSFSPTLTLPTVSNHQLSPNFVVPPPQRDPSPLPQRESQLPVFVSPLSPSLSSGEIITTQSFPLPATTAISVSTPSSSSAPSNTLGTPLTIPTTLTTPTTPLTTLTTPLTTPTTTTTPTTPLTTSTTPLITPTTPLTTPVITPTNTITPLTTTANTNPVTTVTANFDISSQQVPMAHSPAVGGLASLLERSKSHMESDSLIRDNINIRYAMQDTIVSFTQCSNMIANNDFDWSYLETLKQ
ncbi:inhibitor of nuclear factor kappa-B kinase subunit alpha [Homalodisca vitripennis]|uniref:inhibitor of nuclear factor kappa-B kinase subunit alpha n=1 Tax=Homalodisca vitripennis TaxID=197043 RepID=UPI001EEA5B3E|nr:inhibitor of nuclear factor kappa-B kinase subunit alpha [Homalodisca vitripennis]